MKKHKILVLTFVTLLGLSAFNLLDGQVVKVNAATVSTMTGIDVYSGTNVTDWTAVKNAGVTAVYIKLTDGLTYNNPLALAQYNGAKSAGLKVGAYHYAEDNDVDSEYNHFESQASKYQWDLKPVLDYEVAGNTDLSFISTFMAKDSNLIFYSSHSVADVTGLPINRIWVAEPSDAGGYAFTGTTKGYAGIQYLWHGSINGLQGDADVDLFSNDDILLAPQLPALLCVDTPLNNSTIPNSVSVVGWTLNASGNKQVDILVDGIEKGTATIGVSRTDVSGIYPSYNNPNSGFSYNIDTSSLDYGDHTITVKSTAIDGSTSIQNINLEKSDPANSSSALGVTYRSQVQNLGWQTYVNSGEEAGTDGQGLRLETLDVKLLNAPAGASIQYQTQVKNLGWMPLVSDGADAGTVGQELSVETLRIKLVNMPNYSVQYQAQVQSIGWQPWVSDGADAGTVEQGLRLEAIRIKIVPKIIVKVQSISLNKAVDTIKVSNTDTLTATINPTNATNTSVNWTSSNNGVVQVDTTGKITGVTAGNATVTATSADGNIVGSCSVAVNSLPVSVNYSAQVQNIGWMPMVSDGADAGTVGLRLEAIRIKIVAVN